MTCIICGFTRWLWQIRIPFEIGLNGEPVCLRCYWWFYRLREKWNI